MNLMKNIRMAKLTLNVGAGKDTKKLDKGLKLLKNLTGIEPIKTITTKRIPTWGLRPGLPIGCKLTLRQKSASDMLKRLLSAKDNKLKESYFDNNGNVSFGIQEYIDVAEAKYDPEIGMMGFQVCLTLERPGFRIKRRRMKNKIHKNHLITKENSIEFLKKEFGIKLEEEEE